MLRKGFLSATLLAFVFLITSVSAYELVSLSNAPISSRGDAVASSKALENASQLARGYGWKRARKKSTAKNSKKKAELRAMAEEMVIAPVKCEQLARGYGWKRARKNMMA